MTERDIMLTRHRIGATDPNRIRDALDEVASPRGPFAAGLADVGLDVYAAFVESSLDEPALYQYLEGPNLAAADRRLTVADHPVLQTFRDRLQAVGVPAGVGDPAGEPLLREVVAVDDERRDDTDVLLGIDPVNQSYLDELKAVYDEIGAKPREARAALSALDVLAESAYLVESASRPWLTLYVETNDWETTQNRYAASERELDIKHRETLADALGTGGVQLVPILHLVTGRDAD